MRLKWIREGIEDWEYVQILRCSGQANLANFALNIATQIGPDWTNWTRDTDELYSAKISLGEEIHYNSTLPLQLPPVKIIGTPSAYYSSIQTAYYAAVSDDIIISQATVFTEDLLIDMNKSVLLEGGFDCDYSTGMGVTILSGNITT
jgi:hypothetical protein